MARSDPEMRRPLLLNSNGAVHEEEEAAMAEGGEETYDWLWRPLGESQQSAAARTGVGGRRTLPFSLGNIGLWYTAYFGVFFNMVLFLREVMGEGSGAAANGANNWLGCMFLASLAGAFVAESYLGRLWSCALFQALALLGAVLTTIATTVLVKGSAGSGGTSTFFYISIYMMSIGCGGLQSTLQALSADQFEEEGDRAAFFTRYLVVNNVGIALGDTVIVYVVSTKGWVWGFWMCSGAGVLAALLFACGMPFYRQYVHTGNPFARALKVVVAAARKWRVEAPADALKLYEESGHQKHTDSFRWLDKAATVVAGKESSGATPRDTWKLSTVAEVEEMKGILRLLPVWASAIYFNTAYAQAGTLFVEQGACMDTSIVGSSSSRLAMAPASMNMFGILTVVCIPSLYNAAVLPLARSFTGHPRGLSPLHRIACGYLLSIVSLCVAAALETVRLSRVNASLAPPSIFWQVPQFVLLGAAQFLGGIGQSEFFYMYSPPALRSLGSSLYLTCVAAGDYVSSALVSIVTLLTTRGGQVGWIPKDLDQGHLDYFFWLMAALAFLNLLFFMATTHSFMQQHHRQNATFRSMIVDNHTFE